MAEPTTISADRALDIWLQQPTNLFPTDQGAWLSGGPDAVYSTMPKWQSDLLKAANFRFESTGPQWDADKAAAYVKAHQDTYLPLATQNYQKNADGTYTYTLPDEGMDLDFMKVLGLPFAVAGAQSLFPSLAELSGAGAADAAWGANPASEFMGAGVDPVVAADAATGTGMFEFGAGVAGGAPLMPPAVVPSQVGYSVAPYSTAAGTTGTLATLADPAAAAAGMGLGAIGGAAGAGAGAGLASTIANALGIPESLVSGLGRAIPGLIGAFGANSQADAIKQIAAQEQKRWEEQQAFDRQRYEEAKAMGAPYRTRLSDLYANPSAFLTSPEVKVPVEQGTSALMRALSTQGNPFGSGRALTEGQDYASKQLFGRLGSEKDRLAGFGGLTAYNQAGAQGPAYRPFDTGTQLTSVGADRGIWDALGLATQKAFNPTPQSMSLADLYKLSQGWGLS